jgi:hypothetical protein
MKELCMITRNLLGKFQQSVNPVKDKDENPLTTTEEQVLRLAEHLDQLLNHQTYYLQKRSYP